MVRIAFVDQTGGAAGGAQESFALLLRHLPRWIDPYVVLFNDGEYAGRLRSYGLNVTILPIARGIAQSRREAVQPAGAFATPTAVMLLARWFKAQRIAVAYTHTVKAHFLAAPAARLVSIPCVMHLRDILEGPARTALRLIASTCSNERIAISRGVADAYALPRTTVIFNPVDLEKFDVMPSREEACARLGLAVEPAIMTVGMVGRINRWKGQDRFVRIAAAISKSVNARFAIVGSPIFRDNDFLPELRSQAASAGLADRVHFIPWVDDVRWAYAALDLHCNCSEREPFGRTIVEAAAAGVPTVCFSDAGASEVLTDRMQGRIIPAGDEQAFAAAVRDIVSDSQIRAEMSAGARELARRFRPSAHAAAVAQILEHMAA